ncbi:PmoA family protein [Streptomyces cocklensis]|uniref:Methane monooxygenase PmoA-like n=1 Tax=Actinacidiphila cocklensis TaxID=887465 RepID=A0A9W4GQ54_9ACTN|nr:PmoA family protein [Actinacidiphila cocklensis]MDD1061979.1 PmoA family protein [Actinacidiphila cocklensis]CAG6391226.1 Methane monooxygenase PmoA-like [Actinacidiphila cocklensis]
MRTADDGACLTVEAAGVQLLRYVHAGDPEPSQAPKPYLHPLRTTAGEVVTDYRPADHLWHKGLALTASHVSGQNFWGGGTYVREAGGYVDLDNHGTMRHDGFDAIGTGRFAERLTWLSGAGEPWVGERRVVGASVLGDDVWELAWHTELTGLRDQPLRFGSPTTHGRELAGYSGLTWRGAAGFTGGDILGPGGRGGEAMMGTAAPWLAFRSPAGTTVVFEAAGGEGAPPTHWFVRSEPYPIVNPSWAFHEEFTLAAGRRLDWDFRVTVVSAAWDADRVEEHLQQRDAAS